MPKKPRGESYFEHDNRDERPIRMWTETRDAPKRWHQNRVQFGPSKFHSGSRISKPSRGPSHKNRPHLQPGPGVPPGGGRYHRYAKQLPKSVTSWYRVIVKYGARYDKKWILSSLLSAAAPETFTPIGYVVANRDAVFYTDDHNKAEKLYSLSNKINTDDGYKLTIVVTQHTPYVTIDDNLKEAMKAALNNRFNPQTKGLDLSRFHSDPHLAEKYLVPLNVGPVLTAVINLVLSSCPTLVAINLAHNNLYTMSPWKNLAPKLEHLKTLYLAHNKLRNITDLDHLKGLELTELIMDSNPVCAKYVDSNAYVSDVRKRFPKLQKLDGLELPPPILFDVEESKLPPTQASFICSDDGKGIVRQFLEQFYVLYDSENREPLKDAYHEKAMFSVSCVNSHNQSNKPYSSTQYMNNNRNLKKVTESDRRLRTLMLGRDAIIKFFTGLPRTQHDPCSFAVDLVLFKPQLMQLCVSGVFRETQGSGSSTLRAFSRNMVIIPQGVGYCIVNETLTIANATKAQSSAAFKSSLAPVAPAPVVMPHVAPLAPVALAPTPASTVGSEFEMKRQMVEHVARETGMNLSWSEKCLSESNWDVNQALYAFFELKKQGTIPAEAFVK